MIPKFILATAALASAAMASNTTGPYTLQVTGKQDTSIAGMACTNPLRVYIHTLV